MVAIDSVVVALAVEGGHPHAAESLLAETTSPCPQRSVSLMAGRYRPAAILRPLMAVPKRRQSSSRRDKRRATHAIEAPRVNVCPQCGQPKRPHRVCPTCGTYKGREVEPLRIDAP